MGSISAAAARRIALAATGLADPRPDAEITNRQIRRTVEKLGLLQIDSVSVIARAHYQPLFSRLGRYPSALLDAAVWSKKRWMFEYWVHEASFVPITQQPLLRWRMARALAGRGMFSTIAEFGRDNRAYIDSVLREIDARGPTPASAFEERIRNSGGWWQRSNAKRALEWLFWTGQVTAASRRGFERVYDLPERVFPDEILALPTPPEADAHRDLLRIAARALGIATAGDLRDYHRLGPTDALPRIAELIEEGELVPVAVDGWKQQAYLHRDARRPRQVDARALVCPFDPIVWHRPRTERLFDFHYRIEIYTPAEKRNHGYYVLPFLLGDRLVARVDLKADRPAGTLRVLAAYAEPHHPAHTAEALARELAALAEWLGLEMITVSRKGDLAAALAARLL